MPDYTAWAKAFGGGSKPKVAGYLPAPKKARFVSGAERAAEGLGETVKAESLKNSLLRGGAKPAELEYAGLDDFIAGNAGKKVSRADVMAHLKAKGPLSQLQQVDQKHVTEPALPDDWREQIDAQRAERNHLVDMWNEQTGEFTAAQVEAQVEGLKKNKKPIPTEKVTDHPVSTFDEQGAFPRTVYHHYTEQGKKGDHSNYRETLIRDPANHPDGRTSGRFGGWGVGSRSAINAHDADYWLRYHNNPDAIAVQNVQSDIGQDISKHGSHQLLGAEDGEPMTFQQWTESLLKDRDAKQAELDAGGDSTLGIEIAEINAEIERLAKSQTTVSPIAKGDNWKNLLARHVLLQAAESGKPITLPTGKNANAVEGMPVHAATHFYEKDFPDRIAKIAKQYGDGAAGVNATRVDEHSYGSHPTYRGYPEIVLGSRKINSDETSGIGEQWGKSYAPLGVSMRSYGPDDQAVVKALADFGAQLDLGWPYAAGGDLIDLSGAEKRLARAFESHGTSPDLSESVRKAASDVLSRIQLARERGQEHITTGRLAGSPARQDGLRPGTHLNLTPIARRNILDRGMDIMSITAPITAGALYGLTDDSQKRPMPQNLGNAVSH